MAVGFRRTLSTLTSHKAVAPSFLLDCARPKKLSYARVRSTSLPVRLHPLVAGLHDAARALLKWADAPAQTGARARVADGADRAGRCSPGSPTCSTTRRRRTRCGGRGRSSCSTTSSSSPTSTAASGSRSSRSGSSSPRPTPRSGAATGRASPGAARAAALGAEVSRLASSARDLSHRAAPGDDADEATLADAFAAAASSVAAAAAAVFAGVSSASAESAASAAPSPRTPTPYSPARTPASPMWLVTDLLRRRRTVSFEDYCNEEEEERKAAMARVRGLEECVAAAESGCEEVYRALVNARVSLLNLLTPTF